jgi:hypothetical protein
MKSAGARMVVCRTFRGALFTTSLVGMARKYCAVNYKILEFLSSLCKCVF